jgi:hypothetical protein
VTFIRRSSSFSTQQPSLFYWQYSGSGGGEWKEMEKREVRKRMEEQKKCKRRERIEKIKERKGRGKVRDNFYFEIS